MFCGQCGQTVDAADLFCQNCGNPRGARGDASGQNAVPGQEAVPATAGGAPVAGGAMGAAAVQGTVQAAGGAFRVIMLLVVLAVAVTAVAGGVYYFVLNEPGPADTVEKFIDAVNEKDLNTAMECVDPMYEKAYKGASGIIGGLVGVEVVDLADMFPALFAFSSELTGDKTDYAMEVVRVESENVSGDTAEVVVVIAASRTDSAGRQVENLEERSLFYLEKFSEGWRIVDIE